MSPYQIDRPPAPPPRPSFLRGIITLRRDRWEMAATVLIAAGVVMLMQPLSIGLYGWSFAVILAGTAMFLVVSHFPR